MSDAPEPKEPAENSAEIEAVIDHAEDPDMSKPDWVDEDMPDPKNPKD